MSNIGPDGMAAPPEHLAAVFAALGDRTRLGLLAALQADDSQTVSRLAERSHLTRQGLTRHLKVLEDAGIVRSSRVGRERLFRLDPAPLRELQAYLESVSRHWDGALLRLKSMVEE